MAALPANRKIGADWMPKRDPGAIDVEPVALVPRKPLETGELLAITTRPEASLGARSWPGLAMKRDVAELVHRCPAASTSARTQRGTSGSVAAISSKRRGDGHADHFQRVLYQLIFYNIV
jgi:hypothetical protein